MRKIITCLLILFLHLPISFAQNQEPSSPKINEWTGSIEQKLWGLMTIWSEAKYAFPSFDKLTDLNWDVSVQEYIPRVIAAQDIDSYYLILMEFAALLRDGHTGVTPPWGFSKPGSDAPPMEIQVIEDKFVIARAGETDELKNQGIYPGMEIIEIGNNMPVKTYFQDTVLRYYTRGSKQADEGINIWYFLRGPKGSKIPLKIKDTDGKVRNVTLTRDSTDNKGNPFQYRFVQWNMIDPALESKTLPDGILYIKVSHFNDQELEKTFFNLIDNLDPLAIKGMIIDIRYNLGGRSDICENMIKCLIDQSVSSAIWKYPHYIAAYRSWGREPLWSETSNEITPREGKRYMGPLAILTGKATNSTAEDFAIPLHYSGRALLVGERTAGSSGNPISVPLPGGGYFRVSTFKATYPDGRDYVGIGIKPNVEIRPTQEDIYEGKDPVLEKGIEVIKNWYSFKRKVIDISLTVLDSGDDHAGDPIGDQYEADMQKTNSQME
jgi:C-terminal processing protease CtpA/Prc